VPIVPVGIDGLFELWGRNRSFQWKKLLPGGGTTLRVNVGTPIQPEGASATPEAAYSAVTMRLRGAVTTLIS
jgi:hypothetical protein